ncbi:hypothetical protein B0T16DRAFT_422894 [Cercophora newfieldiana]|uniref:Uncharacterized protein n=1 Tax=Cercophora newfieldiana TaxID=92897 RepID=A0AA39XS98_9PEZI|nr:hypothetical protein B0T16DRAFT_422894 [Cercophora newfieldiana]
MASQIYPSPPYNTLPDDPFSSSHRLSTSSTSTGRPDPNSDSHSIMTAPPPYDAAATPFLPTIQLQIETPGKPILSLPLPPRPDPIPIFTIPSSSSSEDSPLTPTYLSLRPTRSSGSCFLISPSSLDPSSSEEEYTPLSTTTYRFGPNRPPLVRLYLPGTATPTSNPFLSPSPSDPSPDADDNDLSIWDSFPLTSPSLLSRTTQFRSRLGTLQWRYASRAERRAISPPPSSLLVLERIVRVSRSENPHKPEEIRTPVAQLIRSEECRSAGSSRSSAGNGGRLVVDLRGWEVEGEKGEGEMVVVMVVTTALVMLKKEVDRRRAQQIMVMAGASGGGP